MNGGTTIDFKEMPRVFTENLATEFRKGRTVTGEVSLLGLCRPTSRHQTECMILNSPKCNGCTVILRFLAWAM